MLELRTAGGLVGLLGALSLAGHALGVSSLVRPLAAFPPIAVLGALLLLLIGVALANPSIRERETGRAAALAVLALAVAGTCLVALRQRVVLAAPVQPVGVMFAWLAAIACLALHSRRRNLEWSAVVVGCGLAMVVATAVLFALNGAGWVLRDATTVAPLARMPLQIGIGAVLTGASLLYTVVRRPMRPSATLPRWAPWGVAIAGMAWSVVVWRSVAAAQERQLCELVAAKGAVVATAIRGVLAVGAEALALSAAQGARPNWEWLAGQLSPVLLLGERTRDGVMPRWLAPDFVPHPDLARALEAAVRDGRALHALGGVDGRAYIVQVQARCATPPCDGGVVALHEAAAMLDPLLPAPGESFVGTITWESATRLVLAGTAGARPAEAARFAADALVATDGALLRISIHPTTGLLRATRTNLPELILLLGILLSGLLAALLRLAAEASTAARAEERTELLLALASVERAHGYEWDLRTGNVLRTSEILRLLGLTRESLGAQEGAWRARIHPDDATRVEAAVADHLAGRSDEYVVRYRIRAGDGSWHQVIDRGTTTDRDAQGAPVRIVGQVADLDATAPRAASPFELGTLAQVMLAPTGQVITGTRSAEQFLTQVDGESRPRLATAFTEDAVALDLLLGRAVREGTVRGDLRLRDTQGQVHDMELAVTPLHESSGRRGDEMLLELWDVTERRAADALRAEADRLMTLGRLSARVAHEINNPLAGIRTAFQLVKRALPRDDPAWPFAEAIEREVARIAAVTRQLYETYRPDRSPPTASVATVVGDAVALLGQAAQARGVRVAADLAAAPARVDVPEAALRQAVYNLVQNAIEASPDGGTVTVTVAHDGDGALALAVRDEGPGIPAPQRERIFDEGFTTKRGSPATSGLGIGLALVRQSVTSLGGTIRVHDAPGGGAEFRVVLPAVPRPRPGAVPS